MSTSGSAWEQLDPWEKAAQWREVAPEISAEIVRIAKSYALQNRQLQDRHEREEAEQARRAHELKTQALENDFFLKRERMREEYKLANRLWWTQLVGLVGGLAAIGALIATASLLAATGNVSPALAVLGVGLSLTAAVYGANNAAKKTLATLYPAVGKSQEPDVSNV